jgi:hypothetical protein
MHKIKCYFINNNNNKNAWTSITGWLSYYCHHPRRARKGKETLCTTRWHTAVKLCRGRWLQNILL